MRLAFLRWAVVTVPFILLTGFASARFLPTGSQNGWFVALAKPQGMPEQWVFPAAWAVLYVLLGLALAMIINARGSRLQRPAIILFAIMMAGNFAWPLVFFGAHQVQGSMILIGALGVLALVTAVFFARVRIVAALFMLPYIAWLAYAGMLLYQIDQLNPDAANLAPGRSTDQIEVK
ncbi:TspO/MBR family protein [Sphingomonas sp.]|uniref:TspO/MBR family protein n=1 Tax=Sphingomonas sp. TaxID=28214 RepID=UPI0025F6FB04|nr:TspO/MBR family protein [Sphingomonas sp.]